MKIVFRYENNLTNASLFANLTLDGLPQLVPGRLFTTRMPRDIVKDPQERKDFVHKCKVNNLVRVSLKPCPQNWRFQKVCVILLHGNFCINLIRKAGGPVIRWRETKRLKVEVWKPESNKMSEHISTYQAINVKSFTTSLHHTFFRG